MLDFICMNDLIKVTVRELQHKLSDYLEIAKVKPILVTKNGKNAAIVVNPNNFKIVEMKEKKKSLDDIMSLPFIGMHKNKKEWKGKSTNQITAELRRKAWYGK